MSTEPRFNIASVKTCTEALGPGKRMAIWFQGCDIHCKDCCNPELQPLEIRNLIGLSELLDIARSSKENNGVEGVTLIGGEPTLQSGLPDLTKGLHALDLGVILFTGRLFEELNDNLVANIDMVIDGRFETDNRDTVRNLIGSNNQRIINVTDRYSSDDWFTNLRPDYIEIDVGENSFISNGSAF